MTLAQKLRAQMVLPAICAPMMIVSYPELVIASAKNGVMSGLPRHNARTSEEFGGWLQQIDREIGTFRDANPDAIVGPIAANIIASRPVSETLPDIKKCIDFGITTFITALGNPAEMAKAIHDCGGTIIHDVTKLRFAEKAIQGGVDGLVCIGGGGGGHSGGLNPFAFIPKVRAMWDGLIVCAGCISDGASIRAAEILGADLIYLGTRFIATVEANAPHAYKKMLVENVSEDLSYTLAITGVNANWLKPSLERVGIDLDTIAPAKRGNYDHLPGNIRPWRDIWSAGQGIDAINDIPSVAELVTRLRREYTQACALPDMTDAASDNMMENAHG